MNFDKWAEEYFAKFPASQDTRLMYTAAKAAWRAAEGEAEKRETALAKRVEELTAKVDHTTYAGFSMTVALLRVISGIEEQLEIDVSETRVDIRGEAIAIGELREELGEGETNECTVH